MDNREAMIAAYTRITENQWVEFGLDGAAIIQTRFEKEWQAATAHNTDAVIDKCINEVQRATDEFVTSVHLGFNFKFNEMVEDMMNRLRALKSSAIKIRSLKINKEG